MAVVVEDFVRHNLEMAIVDMCQPYNITNYNLTYVGSKAWHLCLHLVSVSFTVGHLCDSANLNHSRSLHLKTNNV